MTCPSADGNRNALLALHFGELDAQEAARARTHAEGCPPCAAYLAELTALEQSLFGWKDERPAAAAGTAVLAQAVRAAQAPAVARPRPRPATSASAIPLLGLPLLMVAMVAATWWLAGWLPALWFWPRLEEWPSVETVLPLAVATLVMLALGGLATLAAAPALVLEARRQET